MIKNTQSVLDISHNLTEDWKMKTRFLIIIGMISILAVFVIVYAGFTIKSDSKPQAIFCGDNFIQQGDGCVLDPQSIKSIKPNTVMIFQAAENTGRRLAIAPSTLVIDFEEDNTITWINQGLFSAKVTDREKGLWSIEEIKPSMQKSIQFNSTGFYSFLVVEGIEGESGRIVVLGDDVDSLSVGNRAKMAQAIISGNFSEYPELISVSSGGAPGTGVLIEINEKELELHDNATSHYYEKYSKIIPFDVPITIEFGEPIGID